MKMGEKSAHSVIDDGIYLGLDHILMNDPMRTHFYVLCDGQFLRRKTTAIYRSPYYDLYDCIPLHGGHPHRTGQKFVNSPFHLPFPLSILTDLLTDSSKLPS